MRLTKSLALILGSLVTVTCYTAFSFDYQFEFELREALFFESSGTNVGQIAPGMSSVGRFIHRVPLYFSEGRQLDWEEARAHDLEQQPHCVIGVGPDHARDVKEWVAREEERKQRQREDINRPVAVHQGKIPFAPYQVEITRKPSLGERMRRIGRQPVSNVISEFDRPVQDLQLPPYIVPEAAVVSIYAVRSGLFAGLNVIGLASSKRVGRDIKIACGGPGATDWQITRENLSRAFGDYILLRE